jgi:catechol 2,3-dioxygenase-like lactoylglutathione lyase family enzyme
MLSDATYVGFVPVRSTSEARKFYVGVLGLPLVEDTPFALVVDAHGTHLRITPVPELTVQPFTIAGWAVPAIEDTVRALQAEGVECVRFDGMDQNDLGVWTAPGGDQVAWFRDPDGNTLSLTTFATG